MSNRARSTTAIVVTTAVATSSLLVALGGVVAVASGAAAKDPTYKNVIYLLGDGMGRTHVNAARQRFYGADGKLVMETMPSQGYVSTYSVQKRSGQPGEKDFSPNLVTDSAAAATAWSSGVKSYNNALGIDAKGNVKDTVMELAHKAGYRTGNVSTAEITDATPAGQFSHALLRGCQGPTYKAETCQDTSVTGHELPETDVRVTPIAKQIARNGVADVILGGGLGRFDSDDEKALVAGGYTVLGSPTAQKVATSEDLRGATGQKVFGLFNTGNMTIERTKRLHPATKVALEPTLSEMTSKALSLLTTGDKGKGFYLQVEGALIDKRSHANDAGQTLEEIKAFDEAVRVALDFAKKDGHTLVMVTADHECAGFAIVERDSITNAQAKTLPLNEDARSPGNNSDKLITEEQEADPSRSAFAPATFRIPTDPPGVKDGSPKAGLWLTYLSGDHTGADVPIFAFGPGSKQLQGTTDNTALFDIVRKALAL